MQPEAKKAAGAATKLVEEAALSPRPLGESTGKNRRIKVPKESRSGYRGTHTRAVETLELYDCMPRIGREGNLEMRTRVFGVLAAAVVLAGCGTETPSDNNAAAGQPGGGAGSDTPLISDDGDVLLSCGSSPAFWASAMDGGVSGLADDAEVEAALEELAVEAGIDAPSELQQTGAADAEWIVLAKETDGGTEELLLGLGRWDPEKGPIDGQYVVLDRTADGWSAGGWGDCNLEPVLQEGLAWAEISAAQVGLDPASSTVALEVRERECTSGRDPLPFLHEPTVTEADETVTVSWTSDAPHGDQTCQGTPAVKMVVELDEPLGSRTLLDGSTWPPKPVT